MIKFSQALENFQTGICFKMTDDTLTLNQLIRLHNAIKTKPKPIEFVDPGYQIHLENILLVVECRLTSCDSEEVIAGTLTAREHAFNIANEADVCFLNFSRNIHICSSVNPSENNSYKKESSLELENLLIELLNKTNFWHSITLKNIYFLCNGNYEFPSVIFHYQLLSILTLQTKSLKNLAVTLVVKPFCSNTKMSKCLSLPNGVMLNYVSLLDNMAYRTNFKKFLTLAVGLESLNIGTGQPVSSFISELNNTLIRHPHLTWMDLENVFLNVDDYDALEVLLNENYHIQTIKNFRPVSSELQRSHTALMDRLQLSGLERFRLQQLAQNKLIHIATEAIENDWINQLVFVVGPETQRQAIITDEAEFKKLYQTLPAIYKRFHKYTEICISDFKLALWEQLENDPSQTVGCWLLKKAIDCENGGMIIHLLDAGANILEYFKMHENNGALLALLLDSKSSLTPAWKKMLVNHLQQDLCLFFPAMQRLLSLKDIYESFNEIKWHLNDYLQTLLARNSWPVLLKIITGIYICFKIRQCEWEQAMGKVVNALEIGTRNDLRISCLALDELQDAVVELIKTALSSKRGWMGRSKLNDGLVDRGEKLETKIRNCKRSLLLKIDLIIKK